MSDLRESTPPDELEPTPDESASIDDGDDETVRMTPLLWTLGIAATLLGIALGFILSAVSFRS